MKKTLFYAGAALAMVFSLNSCNKEIENPNENNDKKGIPFEIVANPVQTRTQMDGLDTKWVANDAINVFHSVSGATPKTYVSDGEFTIADVSTNRFQGTVSEDLNAEYSYDWYMVYPYNQYLVSVNNVGDNPARYYIGGRSDEAQTQNGNDNNEHLAGDKFPLFGVVTGLAANETPSISVNHVASYIEVSVTNNTEEPLTVESVSFTAPDGEKIMGYFNIDFAANPISFTMYNTYASETASLTVNNGEEIATGEKGSFFLGIKPFTVSSGVLKVKVNGYEKVINITKSTSFTAGKIKKINFNYDKVEEEYVFKPENFELATSIAAGDKIIITDGTSGTVAVMKHYEGTNNNYKKVNAQVSSGVITSTEDMAVLTVGGTSGNWTFLDESNSLYVDATGTTTANHLKANSTVTENGKWSVSFAAVGNAVITCTGKTSHNIIRYNNTDGQNLFSCYSSGQQPVYIFKQLAPKVLQSITLSGNYQTEFYVGDSFNYDGLVVTATYEDNTTAVVTPTSVSAPDLTQIANNVPVTVTYTEGDVTKTASYTVNVTARPTYVVTLGDDNTQFSVNAGESVTLPERTTTVTGYSFEGWSTTNITSATTSAPTIISAGTYTPEASIILYPVFSSGENTITWAKIALNSATEGQYILVNESNYAFSGSISSGHGSCTSEKVVFNGDIATSIPEDAILITFSELSNGAFTMHNADKGYLIATKAASGGLAWGTSDSNGWKYYGSNWEYNKSFTGTYHYAYLRSYNHTTTGFRVYGKNDGDGPLTLVKKTETLEKSYISNPQ